MDKQNIMTLLFQISQGSPPDAKYIDEIDVGTKEYINYFEKNVLDSLVFNGYSTCRVFDGPYGSGKSHILNMMQGLAIRKKMIYSKIDIGTLGGANFQEWHYVVSKILNELTYYDGSNEITGISKILSVLPKNNTNISLEGLTHRGLANAIKKYVTEFNRLTEVQKTRLSNFIIGNRVNAKEMKEAGIRGVKNPLNRQNAEYFLNTVLNMIYKLGYPVILLFDENEENLGNPNSIRNQVAANIIRRIVDNCSNGAIRGAVIVFTVVRGFIENIAGAYSAVGERLMPPNVKDFTWRWPVLKVEDVSTIKDKKDFLDQCIRKYISIAKKTGADLNNINRIKEELETAGKKIVDENPGISFRRKLSRQFASIVYNSKGVNNGDNRNYKRHSPTWSATFKWHKTL